MNQFELTKSIVEYRKKTDAFKESIESRPSQMSRKFYDGPPFANGTAHYGHLLQSTVKDMVPRWMTMRGYRVERKRGWDCHGIPAENSVNKELGITSKKQVEEEIGLGNYVEACRTMVGDVNEDRKRFIDHLGRWVDVDNAYFTMNNEYMESVIHLFADLYNNNLIYKGFKVLGYSRALGTALSNSEIAEGYMDRQDPAVTVKLKAKSGKLKDMKIEKTKEGHGEVAMGVIKEGDKVLMVSDTRSGRRFMPGGKVDLGESQEETIRREIKEEINVDVVASKFMGRFLGISHGNIRNLNHYEIEVDGEFKNLEPEKQGALAWVSKVEFDNDLGFALKIEAIGEEGGNIVSEVDEITHDFAEFIVIDQKLYDLDGIQDAQISLLARTTTPWTLPSNMFGAVNNSIVYAVLFDHKQKEYYVIAKDLVNKFYKDADEFTVIEFIKGNHFVGLEYEPLFDYYYTSKNIDALYHSQVHKIMHADFVTQDSGTGIAHEAPAFGEDDYNLVVTHLPADKARDWLFNPVDDNGEFTNEVSDFAGMNVIESNKEVIKNLKERGLLFKQETLNHSYPHCPRTKTPLIYRAMESRFVKEKVLTAKTLPLAEQINFVPDSIKTRFTNGLASAPDWNISRSRFRGAPLPVWECEEEECEERKVFGSIKDIAEASGQEVTDLHRPYIDEITLPCSCGKTMKRIPEVLDCWFESGSMPYGQSHYMKAESGKLKAKNTLPEGYKLIDDLPQERWEEFKELRLESTSQEPALGGKIMYDFYSKRTNQDWIDILRNEGIYFCFIEYNGKLIGCMKSLSREVFDEEKEIGGLFSFYIMKSHRGKGLGKKLFIACYQYLLSLGYIKRIEFNVIKGNEDLIPRYQNRGFEILDNDYKQYVEGDLYIDCIRLGADILKISFDINNNSPFSTTADFIAEGLDQTRGWFRALHVLGAAYTDNIVYKNVVITGMILAEDGKKMSKSLKNYPDPRGLLEQYGSDAFRLYVLGSPVVRAEPLRFSEQGVEQVLKDFVIPLQNVWNFFKTYAEVDGWKDEGTEVYFMRHAEKDKDIKNDESIEHRDIPLSEKGKEEILSKDFVERVTRVNPDVIITTNRLRAMQTAEGVQKVLKAYTGNDIEVIQRDNLVDGFDQDTCGKIYQNLVEEFAGKRVLIVSHRWRFLYLWNELFDADFKHRDKDGAYGLSSTQIVKLPTTKIHNELDQRIMSELYTMMAELDQHLESYELEPATKIMMGFMDKLTNRWLRRSRRRFWAEGMDDDKQAVYWTLWEVLSVYLKLAAPFAPFVTEGIRQEMHGYKAKSGKLAPQDKNSGYSSSKPITSFLDDEGKAKSVHLEYRPLSSEKWINKELSEEITQVRKIIKGAMYLRAKHQIKVKQPLKELRFGF